MELFGCLLGMVLLIMLTAVIVAAAGVHPLLGMAAAVGAAALLDI